MTAVDWTVVYAADAANDMALIEEQLIRAYRDFGENQAKTLRHAESRIEGIIATAERLRTAPSRGEAQDDLLPDLRHLDLDRAIYWFVPDREARQIRVLAVLFGGQNHQRHMLVRLLRKGRS